MGPRCRVIVPSGLEVPRTWRCWFPLPCPTHDYGGAPEIKVHVHHNPPPPRVVYVPVPGGTTVNPVALIRGIKDGDARYEAIVLWCPGCQYEDPDDPGKPSILTRTKRREDQAEFVCHSFLRNGTWQFLGDCTHALVDRMVPMVPLPDWVVR